METIGNDSYNVYKFPIPEGNYTKVLFTNKIKTDGTWDTNGGTYTKETINIQLIGNSTVGYGHGYKYMPEAIVDNRGVSLTTIDDKYCVQVKEPADGSVSVNISVPTIASGKLLISPKKNYQNAAKIKWYSWTAGSGNGTWNHLSTSNWDNSTVGYNSPDSINVFQFDIPSGANAAQIICTTDQNNGTEVTSRKFRFSDIPADKPIVYIPSNSSLGSHWGDTNVYDIDFFMPSNNGITITFSGSAVTQGGSGQSTYSYHPEDRYGMISDQNTTTGSEGVLGTADVNDFIKITLPDTVTKPYIKFYNGNTEINNATGSTASTKGLLLNGSNMTLNRSSYTIPSTTGTGTKTYQVRLPIAIQ